MKRGGQLIYSGSLGPLSSSLIKYFEVRLILEMTTFVFRSQKLTTFLLGHSWSS